MGRATGTTASAPARTGWSTLSTTRCAAPFGRTTWPRRPRLRSRTRATASGRWSPPSVDAEHERQPRDTAEVQPRCSRGAAEMQPRCSRDAAEVQPRCRTPACRVLRVALERRGELDVCLAAAALAARPRTATRSLSPLDAGSPARTLSRCKRQRRSRRTTARPASCTAASTSTTARCTRGSPRRRRTAPIMQGRRRARRRRSRRARRRSRLHEGGLPSEARTSARCGWGRVVRGRLRVQCMRGGRWRSRAASVMNSRCVCRWGRRGRLFGGGDAGCGWPSLEPSCLFYHGLSVMCCVRLSFSNRYIV